jgi:hypothetical protein
MILLTAFTKRRLSGSNVIKATVSVNEFVDIVHILRASVRNVKINFQKSIDIDYRNDYNLIQV